MHEMAIRRAIQAAQNTYVPLRKSFFDRQVDCVARDLIGAILLIDGVGGVIVETESYDEADPASHSYRGPTNANGAMFGPSGHAYVYRSYGVHWCLNFVCRRGSAILIRALEPGSGIQTMQARRGIAEVKSLCAGPGRLCQALGVTGSLNGASLFVPPFSLQKRRGDVELVSGVRIGITKAREKERRFGAAGSPYLSRRFPIPNR